MEILRLLDLTGPRQQRKIHVMSIQYPWALLLLAVVPAVLYLQNKTSVKTGFSRVAVLGSSLEPGPVKKYAADVLAVLVMVLMVFAIANIQYSSYWHKTFLESRWIMLVQDLSGSMGRPGDEGGRSRSAMWRSMARAPLSICAARMI